MNKPLQKHWIKLDKKEKKIVLKQSSENAIQQISNKIEEKIPANLKKALYTAFYKAFHMVFENGIGFIEKTMSKDKLMVQYDINHYTLEKDFSTKNLKNMDKQAAKSKLLNSTLTTTEGAVLGFIGVGLPDIPIFIGILLKGLCETALSYGFSYDSEDEKYYLLALIICAISDGDDKVQYNTKLDDLAIKLNHGQRLNISLEQQIQAASNALSDEILTSKFIQGFPIVGIIGSAKNLVVYRKILNYANIKYKKRYLVKIYN